LFLPQYVSVCAWQFGQINLRFFRRWLWELPSLWSSCITKGCPFQSLILQTSQQFSLMPSLINLCFNLKVWYSGYFPVKMSDNGILSALGLLIDFQSKLKKRGF
jgi:hypothetical protein